MDLISEAVEIAKKHGIPSGVGAHDLEVVKKCEKENINADFYIKTFHHHKYRSAPTPEELKKPYQEFPGYWCLDPDEVLSPGQAGELDRVTRAYPHLTDGTFVAENLANWLAP